MTEFNWKRSGPWVTCGPAPPLVQRHHRGPAGRRHAGVERGVLPAASDAGADRDHAARGRRRPSATGGCSTCRARSSCARRRRRRSASGRSTPCARASTATTAGRTTPRRRTRATSSGTARRGWRRSRTCPASSSSTCSRTTSTPTATGARQNPAIHAFFAAIWPQSSSRPATGRRSARAATSAAAAPARPTRSRTSSRKHYLKEIFLDSATTAAVLSVVPTSPDTRNPLPIEEAVGDDRPRQRAGEARSARSCTRSSCRTAGRAARRTRATATPEKPLYFDEEMELMIERAEKYRDKLRGWKTYCAWGDVPNASGWTLDSDIGMAFLENVADGLEEVQGGPADGRDAQGLPAAGLRPARRGAARRRHRREGQPRREHHRLPLGLRQRRRAEALPRRQARRLHRRTPSTA